VALSLSARVTVSALRNPQELRRRKARPRVGKEPLITLAACVCVDYVQAEE
jgi:hypothetical protein